VITFARNLIAWQRTHGRNDLPWQGTRDPYRIWVSEIMLQQTQVATVIPYYVRFMARFPDAAALAAADLDDVLAHWSGLGYYSRARNLHRAAIGIRDLHGGHFPEAFEEVVALPGIGRSTAAAIVVFAYGAHHAILDGNVKRVLARACGIEGYPGDKAVAEALWSAAERLLPYESIESYTQGLMDLGATVCLRRQPHCLLCPVSESCAALRDSRIAELPAPRPRRALRHRTTVMLVLAHGRELLLEKRPAPGIWGGLWCFPELAHGDDAQAAAARRFGATVRASEWLPDVEHGFTHFRLTISPQRLDVSDVQPRAGEAAYRWMPIDEVMEAGIPAPVKRIVRTL
jgi:A/G-specific adenine glycosylase